MLSAYSRQMTQHQTHATWLGPAATLPPFTTASQQTHCAIYPLPRISLPPPSSLTMSNAVDPLSSTRESINLCQIVYFFSIMVCRQRKCGSNLIRTQISVWILTRFLRDQVDILVSDRLHLCFCSSLVLWKLKPNVALVKLAIDH